MGSAASLPLTTNVTTVEASSTADVRRHLVNHYYSLTWWKHYIFPFLGPSDVDRIHLRRFCRLYRDALPIPIWTTFPHSKYPTLNQLVDQINKVAEEDPSKAPKVVFVSNGVHQVEETHSKYVGRASTKYVAVRCSLKFVGKSREGTVVNGGFDIRAYGRTVRFETMTVTNPTGVGLWAASKFDGKELTIVRCSATGVDAQGTQGTQGTLTDCTVTNCGGGGISSVCGGAIHMHGERTKVTGNCTKVGYGSDSCHGLSGEIVLHAPLTKESVSRNNGGGGNWNSSSTIHIYRRFTSDEKAQQGQRGPGTLSWMPAMGTVNRALFEANRRGVKILYLEKGEHVTERVSNATVDFSVVVKGEGQGVTIVRGGFFIVGRKKDHVRLETMTVTNPNGTGVCGYTAPVPGAAFEGKELTIDGCSGSGVIAHEGGVFKLMDCTVINCGQNGITSGTNGVIHLYGERTKVTGNCTKGGNWLYGRVAGDDTSRGRSNCYGLLAYNFSSKIILHGPLTKESVSHDNFDGRNWNDTMEEENV